jgi:hypothetical protein
LYPGEKLAGSGSIWKDVQDIAGSPPLLDKLPGGNQIKGVREAPGIADDMDDFCQYLWRHGDQVACGKQSGKRLSRGRMGCVLCYLRSYQKACVESMDHAWPSSVSLRRSSSEVNGRSTTPTLTTGMSRMLCGRTPSGRG